MGLEILPGMRMLEVRMMLPAEQMQDPGVSEVSVDVSLPVKWQEDGQAVCHVVFEFNNERLWSIVRWRPGIQETYFVAVLSH